MIASAPATRTSGVDGDADVVVPGAGGADAVAGGADCDGVEELGRDSSSRWRMVSSFCSMRSSCVAGACANAAVAPDSRLIAAIKARREHDIGRRSIQAVSVAGWRRRGAEAIAFGCRGNDDLVKR